APAGPDAAGLAFREAEPQPALGDRALLPRREPLRLAAVSSSRRLPADVHPGLGGRPPAHALLLPRRPRLRHARHLPGHVLRDGRHRGPRDVRQRPREGELKLHHFSSARKSVQACQYESPPTTYVSLWPAPRMGKNHLGSGAASKSRRPCAKGTVVSASPC